MPGTNDRPRPFDEVLLEYLPKLESVQQVRSDLALVHDGGLDSLGMIGLLAAMEQEFDVEIPDEEVNGEMFATPESLWQVVQQAMVVQRALAE